MLRFMPTVSVLNLVHNKRCSMLGVNRPWRLFKQLKLMLKQIALFRASEHVEAGNTDSHFIFQTQAQCQLLSFAKVRRVSWPQAPWPLHHVWCDRTLWGRTNICMTSALFISGHKARNALWSNDIIIIIQKKPHLNRTKHTSKISQKYTEFTT